METRHYTAYSLRIGGTTAASKAGIPHPLILKYVGWSNSRLADCAQRYMRYTPFELCRLPFMILHKSKNNTKKNDKNDSQIYDPWSENVSQRFKH